MYPDPVIKVSMVPAIVRTTTDLVVLGRPASHMIIFLHPLLEFGDSEEVDRFLPMAHSDDGSNELDQEIGELEKRRVKVVEEVDDQSLDVRTIVILKSNVTQVFE